MGYSREIYDEAMRILDKRRTEAEARAAAARERLIAKQPRLREIERGMAGAGVRISRAVLEGGDVTAAVEEVKNQNLALQSEMAAILAREGYPHPNFEPAYACPRCRDTGYANGRLCGCLEKILRETSCKRLSLTSHMPLRSFDEMRLDYYPDEAGEGGGPSPRKRMQDAITFCRNYAERFTPQSPSLILRGPTGTGKTHLSLSIAREVAAKGFGVVYGPAQSLLHRLEKEHFGRETGDSEDRLLECELLILDDLGTELASPFNIASLYNILNGRILAERPTILSTNLNQNQVRKRYGEPIASRIAGTFLPLLCAGKDIRQLRGQEQMRSHSASR